MNDLLLPLSWVTRSRVKRDPDQAHVLRFYRSQPAGWTLQFRIHGDASTQVLSASLHFKHLRELRDRLDREIRAHELQDREGDPE